MSYGRFDSSPPISNFRTWKFLYFFNFINFISNYSNYLDGKYVIRFLLSPPLFKFYPRISKFLLLYFINFQLEVSIFFEPRIVSVEFEYYGIFVRFY